MLDIGFQELLVIFVIALLVFGPRRLPELGRALGRGIREFRRASDEFRSTIESNLMEEPAPTPEPVVATATESPPSSPFPNGTAGLPPLPDEVIADASWDSTTVGTDTPPAPPAEPFIAKEDARLFHRVECEWAKKIAEPDRLVWKRAAEALERGRQPCPVCDPRDD